MSLSQDLRQTSHLSLLSGVAASAVGVVCGSGLHLICSTSSSWHHAVRRPGDAHRAEDPRPAVRRQRIRESRPGVPARAADVQPPGHTVVPGLFDAHAHGGGFSYSDGDPAAAAAAARTHLRHGTTTTMANLVTASMPDLDRAARALSDLVHRRPCPAASRRAARSGPHGRTRTVPARHRRHGRGGLPRRRFPARQLASASATPGRAWSPAARSPAARRPSTWQCATWCRSWATGRGGGPGRLHHPAALRGFDHTRAPTPGYRADLGALDAGLHITEVMQRRPLAGLAEPHSRVRVSAR